MGQLDHSRFETVAPEAEEMFAFESDFVATLRCIPMAVRFKLDLAGIKLSLRQWSRFTLADRSQMLTSLCSTVAEVQVYRARLVELIAARTTEIAKDIPPPDTAPWATGADVPVTVADFALSRGLSPPTLAQWQSLTDLRRFTLLKLSRDNHDNINFAPALREFGLQDWA